MARDVKVAILGDARDFSRAAHTVQGDAAKMDKSFGAVGRGAARMGKAMAVGLGVGVVAGAVAVKGFVDAAVESQKVTAQTDAVIKSMGNQAKVTAEQVADLSTELSMQTGIDDELIQSGSNILLTFGKVANRVGKNNKIFDRATEAALDMSVALGTDMKSASMLVGKALNDPIRGLTALRRSGIQFTKQQEDQIKAMVESGDVLGAQKVLLAELDKQFGGSAAAQATAGDRLKVVWGNLQEQIGEKLLPIFEKAANWLMDVLPRAFATLERVLGPVIEQVELFWNALTSGMTEDEGTWVEDLALKIREFGEDVIDVVEDALAALANWWDENSENIISLAGNVASAASTMWDGLLNVWNDQLKPTFDLITDWLFESPGRMQTAAAIVAAAFGVWAVAATIAAVQGALAGTAPLLPWIALVAAIIAGGVALQWVIDKYDLLPKAAKLVQPLIDKFGWLLDIISEIDRLIGRIFNSMGPLTAIAGGLTSEADPKDVQDIFDTMTKRRSGTTATGGPTRGFLASGGAFAPGNYVVGENGPEVVTMNGHGYVTPNDQLGGGDTYNINVTAQHEPVALAVVRELKRNKLLMAGA